MRSILYQCYETGQITEIEFDYRVAQYMTVKKYGVLYAEELPRFQKNPLEIYALPFGDIPKKVYLGAGRIGLWTGRDAVRNDLTLAETELALKIDEDHTSEILIIGEQTALTYLNLFCDANRYELIYVRSSGEQSEVPEGYQFVGYDVTYMPGYDGGFSIICDCMFFCQWHGCDPEGTLFADDFTKLNEYGLFDTRQDAYDYMVKYLNEDWTERGNYYILEIYRKKI